MSVIAESVVIPHFVRGELVAEPGVHHENPHSDFWTPELELDRLVWLRSQPLPAAEVPTAEIIELLASAGERLRDDRDGLLQAALELLAHSSPYDLRILENSYEEIWRVFDADRLRELVVGELGGIDFLDGWCPHRSGAGSVRAYPARIIHVLAGNSPGVAALTVARGALSKGAHLLKLPSNDLLTATAVLRSIASVAPDHPVVRSFSAVYWRGGDEVVESALFRAQFFDKVVAWGGEHAIRNTVKYLGPGLELIAFDPKNSISMIGKEVFDSEETTHAAAAAAATDATPYNQEACLSSRFQFIEGSIAQVDSFCELLQAELGVERRLSSAKVDPPPQETRDEIETLADFKSMYRVFGQPDGRGLVVRSQEPVEFFPSGKTVNVVMVDSLAAAVKYINVSTQTVGIFPASRKGELRNLLASAGAQRVVTLGGATGNSVPGFPHDGFFPLHRMVRWVCDMGADEGSGALETAHG